MVQTKHRPADRPRRRWTVRTALVALPLLLTSCGGGGIGLSILTVGISAIFAGSSPGAFTVDPAVSTSSAGAILPEPDIALTLAGASVENVRRYLVLGGNPFGAVPAIHLQTAFTSNGPDLAIAVRVRDSDDPQYETLPTATTTISKAGVGTSTPVDVQLPLPKGLQTGDVLAIDLRPTGTDGTLTVQTSSTPSVLEVVVDVTHRRVTLDFINTAPSGTTPFLALISRAPENQKVPFRIDVRAVANYRVSLPHGTTSESFFDTASTSGSTYGTAPKTPPTVLSYNYTGLDQIEYHLNLQSVTSSTTTGTIRATIRSVPLPPTLGFSASSSLVPFSAGPSGTTLAGIFVFPGVTSTDVLSVVGNPSSNVQTFVDLDVSVSGGANVEVLPGSRVVIPGPDVLGIFPGGNQVRLSQPPR